MNCLSLALLTALRFSRLLFPFALRPSIPCVKVVGKFLAITPDGREPSRTGAQFTITIGNSSERLDTGTLFDQDSARGAEL